MNDSATTTAEPGRTPSHALLAAACGLGAFILYAWTTSPFVLNAGVAEFQALSATHGISHTGDPLYVLALQLFHTLPIGTAAYRANLVSGFAAAIAVAMVALASFRLTRRRLAAVASAVALTLSYSLWNDATHAEVYAFTLALSTSAFVACLWYRDTLRVRALVLCTVLAGSALAGHVSSWPLAAVVAWSVLRPVARGAAPRRHVAVALGGLVLGLLPLLLIPLRDAPWTAMNDITRRSLAGGWSHPFQETFQRLRFLLWHLLFNDLHLLGVGLAWAGFFHGIRDRARMNGPLFAWWGLVLLFVAAAASPMVLTSFFLPGLWVLCVWLGAGFARMQVGSRVLAIFAFVLLIAYPLARTQLREPPPAIARPSIVAAWAVWPAAWDPFRHDASWEEFARGLLAELPPRAELIVCRDEGTPLRYMQLAKSVRPDVTLHWSCDSAPRIEQILRDAALRHTQVYATIPVSRLPRPYEWVAIGRWSRGGLARYAAPLPIWRRLLPG